MYEVKEEWRVMAKKADFNRLGEKFKINPVIARIMRNRDLQLDEEYDLFLHGSLKDMHNPLQLKDMDKAAFIIEEAIRQGLKIRVIGDYDIDGICSGFILTDGLEKLGADVDFDVPDRILDGYGINERLIKQASDDGVQLIVTCDNGIAAGMQIEYAKALGIQVVVTDHHEVPFTIENEEKKYILPAADAVVDQKRPDCTYPFKELCGGAIAYKVIQCLMESKIKTFRETALEDDTDEKKKEIILREIEKYEGALEVYRVFAGFATVGDIVDLKDENRILVKIALANIKEIHNMGMDALIKACGLDEKRITAYTIGFVLGPCINAGGRLETAKLAFSLFRSKNEAQATEIAIKLKELNETRKNMTEEYTKKALKMIEEDTSFENEKVLVVYLPDCHESLAGIIAGRIKEYYNKPTFVLTDCENGAKGSGRSIESYSMFEKLVLANSKENVLTKFGGHKMAAGVSLTKENIGRFRKVINETSQLTDENMVRRVWIDVPMPFEYISKELIRQLDLLEPFGRGNEMPVFADKCERIIKIQVRGKNRNVISLKIQNAAGAYMDATLFETEDIFIDSLSKKYSMSEIEAAMRGERNNIKMSVIYYPEINNYNGFENIRVVIKRYSC